MKKRFAMTTMIAVLMCLCFPMAGWTRERVELDKVYYDLYDDHAEVASHSNEISGEVVIPASIICDGKEYPVKKICWFAFGGLSFTCCIDYF